MKRTDVILNIISPFHFNPYPYGVRPYTLKIKIIWCNAYMNEIEFGRVDQTNIFSIKGLSDNFNYLFIHSLNAFQSIHHKDKIVWIVFLNNLLIMKSV